MKTKPLIILGSARKNSDTLAFTEQLFLDRPYELLDLLDYKVFPYDYLHRYPAEDEFEQLIHKLMEHQAIVFATPVYWYAMSGLMKQFFDRLTDLITLKKESGRQLRGKNTFLLAVGADEALPEGFSIPFKRTSDYLGMHFRAGIYFSTDTPAKSPDIQTKADEYLSLIARYTS